MIKEDYKPLALAALAGAAIAVVLILGMGLAGIFPGQSDARIKKYLLANPEVLVEVSQALQAKQEAAEQKKRQAQAEKVKGERLFNPKLAFVTGPANAKNSIVEFYDYNCVHCRNAAGPLKAYYEKHKADTRFAFIEYPAFGADSEFAARVATAIAHFAPDKFMAFHFAMMSRPEKADPTLVFLVADQVGIDPAKLKDAMLLPSVTESLRAAQALAREIGVDGTPTYVLNGKIHVGEVDADTLNKMRKS